MHRVTDIWGACFSAGALLEKEWVKGLPAVYSMGKIHYPIIVRLGTKGPVHCEPYPSLLASGFSIRIWRHNSEEKQRIFYFVILEKWETSLVSHNMPKNCPCYCSVWRVKQFKCFKRFFNCKHLFCYIRLPFLINNAMRCYMPFHSWISVFSIFQVYLLYELRINPRPITPHPTLPLKKYPRKWI